MMKNRSMPEMNAGSNKGEADYRSCNKESM